MKFPSPSSSDAVIRVSELSRQFGSKHALRNVSLYVPRGCVFGLVGENGAGKTTLIKHILGLLRAESGGVEVFGIDPASDPVTVLGRIGFLSEQRDLPGWMSVDELLRYTAAFYPTWDPVYADQLRHQFGIDPLARVKNLSQGQTAKAGLLLALAHRPPLLVLDEPSSGLDPIVRRDILEAIIRTVADEGRTVFFSSHLLDEIERVSDFIAMIHQGRVALTGRLDEIKENHRRLVFRVEKPLAKAPHLEHALSVQGNGREWTAICNGGRSQLLGAVKALGAEVLTEGIPSLDEIFVARAAHQVAG